jgi:glucan 1,3-beta-glucosidase
MGTTGQPAVVYLPAGTYLMENSLQLYVGTVIVGDALNPPTLKASANFPNDHIIYGKDPHLGGTINFYIGFKNVIIDSTAVAASKSITLLDWTVSQATQLTNVVFNMPNYSNHVGVTSQYDSNSNIILVSLMIIMQGYLLTSTERSYFQRWRYWLGVERPAMDPQGHHHQRGQRRYQGRRI